MTLAENIPTVTLGRTGVEVTRLGLGGEGVLRTRNRTGEATAVIHRALDLGITYFESARAYAGSEGYLGVALAGQRQQVFVTSKSVQRTKEGAQHDLETTLRNLRSDYLDLWQVHDVRDSEEWEQIISPGGAIEAFEAARGEGKVRFIGVTGHYDPYLLARALQEYPFDTVLMPVNVAEANLPGFLDVTLRAAHASGAAAIGMKVLGAGILTQAGLEASALIRWALSLPVAVITVGCGSEEEVEANVRAATAGPLSEEEAQELLQAVEPHAAQLAAYRGVLHAA
ncbi:MAG TPA: aldo/keto reductase [Chloroflexota bacterium]|nr:aldo/keto reductase [Chloroflexota bacterium]